MANQLIGNSEVAIHMYQALYDQAPSNSLYDSYVSNINATSPAAFAAGMAGNFNSVSDAALATQVLTNLGVTATTLTATPGSTAAQSYTALSAAVVQLFGAYPTMRGQVILNMTNLLGNLEGDPTYGAAATAYNQQATADLIYASNTGHAASGVAPLAFNQANTLTTGVDYLSGTTLFAPLNGTSNTLQSADTLQSGDTLTGTGLSNVLNADVGPSSYFSNTLIEPTTTNIQTVSLTSYDSGNGYYGQGYGNVTGNNTLSNSGIAATILAGKMTGVTNWVDGPAAAGTAAQGLINPLPGSRADLVIENIQLPHGNPSSDVTSAVTFTLRNTEPGLSTQDSWLSAGPYIPNGAYSGGATGPTVTTISGTEGPSFRAYFDQQALKQAAPVSTNSLTISVGDASAGMGDTAHFEAVGTTLNTTQGGAGFIPPGPLGNFALDGFTLKINGSALNTFFKFQLGDIAAINGATTFAGQETAFKAAILDAVNTSTSGTLASLGWTLTTEAAPYQYGSQDSTPIVRSVPAYQLTAPAGTTVTAGQWYFNSTAQNGIQQWGSELTAYSTTVATSLITSNIILDNVGLGAMPQYNNYSGSTEGPAGDVIIGSLATSGGVQQFNVDVQNGSWINSLSSTNKTLQVVNINSDPVVIPTGGQYLAVGAELGYGTTNLDWYASAGLLVGTNGFTDVQTINALNGPNGAFNGSLLIGETIDYDAFGIYLANATSQVVPFSITLGNQSNGVVLPGQTAAFNSVHLVIDASVASSGNFIETITGGTGNDLVDVTIGTTNYHSNSSSSTGSNVNTFTSINPAAAGPWDINQTQAKNLVINDAAGNNVIAFHNSGAAVITTGAGNDTFYIDNSGGTLSTNSGLLKAVWVANDTVPFTPHVPTAGQTTAGATPVTAAVATETITWSGFTALAVAGNTEVINGITVTNTAGGAFTAAQVSDAVNNFAALGSVPVGGLTVTEVPGWTISGSGSGQTVVTQAVNTGLAGSTVPVLTDGAAGTNTVSLPSAVVNVQGTTGVTAATETMTVTWQAINGLGATETIGGITVTDVGGTSIAATVLATDVAAATPGTLYTDSVNGITVMVPTSGATTWTATQPGGMPGTAQDLLTYGTLLTTYTGPNPLVGTSTVGAVAGAAPVSFDEYGNFTTNVGGQGAAPYNGTTGFTGVGEQVWVSFDGVTSQKVTIQDTASGTNYTTAAVNSAIMTAVNTDAVLNKLLHFTLGSAGSSLIGNSLVDGTQVAPVISFGNNGTVGVVHTGTSSGTYTSTQAAADVVALNAYVLQNATGDGATTGTLGLSLTGAAALGTVNNSSITDAGGTNVIDLSSATGSVNTVTLTGTGTSYLINVGTNEVISTVPTHTVVINYNAVAPGAAGTTVAMGDTAPILPVLSTAANYAAFIAAATASPIHTVLYEVFSGNTFYADANGAVVELVGTHPIAGVAGNHLVLA